MERTWLCWGTGRRVSAEPPLPAGPAPAISETISAKRTPHPQRRRRQLGLSCGCFVSQAVTDTGTRKNVSRLPPRQGYSPYRKPNALAGSMMKISSGSCSPWSLQGLVPVPQPPPARAGRLQALRRNALVCNTEKNITWKCLDVRVLTQ